MARMVLIVDDNEMNRLLLKNTLCRDYDILEAENGREALRLMHRYVKLLSAVLLDIVMPEMNGYEVLRSARENPMLTQIPIIMVTASEDEDSRVKALSYGANDFILKPFNPDIVRHCLKNNIALRETAAILNAIQRDKLTGLYNREAFFEKVSAAIKEREAGYYILSCFDIDSFKLINDRFGAAEGDRILREIGRTVKADMDAVGGIPGRISGDNFAVLLPAANRDLSINRLLQEDRMAFSDKKALVFSIGRYVVSDVSLPASAIYDRAFIAKQSVKGRYDTHVAYFNDQMLEKLVSEQQIITDMDAAIAQHQFEIWFQPQYNHSTGALIGAEALVRWRHPDRGLIMPGVFVPLFEQNGSIYEVDKYVWESACRYLRRELDAGRAPLPVSVNISRYDLFREDFFAYITGLVERYGVPIELLRLEVTESAFAESSKHIIAAVKRLIHSDFTVEIDDFGSGYSSLNTLKSVPAQVLKLDMRFFEEDEDSGRSGNIIESIVRMAKWLGMSVIAEGVERTEQADYLNSVGCCFIQGYLYAKPMPENDYRALCTDSARRERLPAMHTVQNLDSSAFWDPASMDTLIFNSYVGAACILECCRDKIDMLRATERYAQVVGGRGATIGDVLKIRWEDHLTPESTQRFYDNLQRSAAAQKEVTDEYTFLGLPGCLQVAHLRSTIRVIASMGERQLVYCLSENTTAQRQAEQSARRTKERLEAIMKDMVSGITAVVMKDGAVTPLFSNDRFFEMRGYTRATYRAQVKDFFAAVHPDDRAQVRQGFADAYASEQPSQIEYRITRRDGAERWMRLAFSSTRFTDIAQNVLLCLYTDITDKKHSERAIADTAAQLQAMMDDMPGGYARVSVEPDGRLLPAYLNEGFCRLVGMERSEAMALYAEDALACVHPDDLRIVRDAMADMLENGEAHSARYRLLHKNGSYVWLSIFGRITRNAAGKTYLSIYYIDAAAQERSERQQKELLDNLPHGAALYEYDGRSVSAVHLNKRYWEMVGRSPAKPSHVAVLEAVHPDDRELAVSEMDAAIRQNRDFSRNLRIRTGDDAYEVFQVKGRILKKDNGKYIMYTSFAPAVSSITYQQMLPLLLSAIMDSTTDLSFAKDQNFRYLSASRAFSKMVGCGSRRDLVGKTDYELFPKEMADRFRQDDEALVASGQAMIDKVESIPDVNGVAHYSSTSKYLLRDGSGEIVGLYGVGRDITEGRAMKTQLEMLANSIPGGLAIYEGRPEALNDIRIIYFSDGFCRLFGYTREAYERRAARNPMGLVFPGDLPAIRDQVRALVRDGTPMDCVYRIEAEDGGFKWIHVKAVMGEPRGDKLTVNALFLDVTDQQSYLEQLRISEEENKVAIGLGGNIICRFNVADRSMHLTPEVAAATGLAETYEDVPYEPVRCGRVAQESADAYIGFFEAIIRGEKTGNVRFKHSYFGKPGWMEAKSVTIFSDAGEPVKAVIVYRDITDQLEKETAYQKWLQSLAGKEANSYSLFRCNLHNASMPYETVGSLIAFDFENAGNDFSKRAKAYAETCVCPEDRAGYCAFANTDTMLSNYYMGRRTNSIEYREQLADGGVRWVRLSVNLLEAPDSTDVEAHMMYEDIDKERKAELEMQLLAKTDPLTGVLNRTALADRVGEIIGASNPESRHALLMLDVDGFKRVNDAFGHGAGDRALIDIAAGLRAAVRHDDLVARLGGDEFVVFLRDIPGEKAAAGKARQICAATRRAFSAEVQISGSVGISVFPQDGADFELLYRRADAALYHVKDTGKDNYAFYRENMEGKYLPPDAGKLDLTD